MTRIDSLRLLLACEHDGTATGIELLLRGITERIDELEPGSPTHAAAHARINWLLEQREHLIEDDV